MQGLLRNDSLCGVYGLKRGKQRKLKDLRDV
jgi:hypothetical protein